MKEIVFYVNEKVNIHEFSKNFLKKIQKKCWQFYLLMIIYTQVQNYRYSNKYFIGTFTESVSGWKHTMQMIKENGLNGKKSEF